MLTTRNSIGLTCAVEVTPRRRRKQQRGVVGTATLAALFCSVVVSFLPHAARAQSTFNQTFEAVRSRPEYAHSRFGVAVYSLDRKTMLFESDGDKLFVPGSTTKLLSTGTVLELLGADYRFHTPVYRTGPVENGVLKGNLVLVASGDPNLSGRLQPDDTLAFSDEDHSYGGYDARLIGDPLAALKRLADGIAAAGIRRIDGQVLVDASLFASGDHELGTGITISPIIINDNVVDVVVSPGASSGAPAVFHISPQPGYIHFVNKMTTGAAGSTFTLDSDQRTLPDGSLEVTFKGSTPLGSGSYVQPFAVPDTVRFAETLFAQVLAQRGITIANLKTPAKPVGAAFAASYTPANRVAEFVSAPLREGIKVTLKVSQNLHAAETQYLLGALLSHAKEHAELAGFKQEHGFLARGGLDLSGASQSDGAGGLALFTPDFMVHYLAYMAAQSDYPAFHHALPILGKDGSLAKIQKSSPAAGHVFAKTGTYVDPNYLDNGMLLTGKGLAGYTTTPSGEHVAFALYANNVPLPAAPTDAVGVTKDAEKVGDALGEIAGAINLNPIAAPSH